ncbi:alpha/beta hydrolase, putative [Ricinus communis]|uniref:Alpha/beta hydrolase, putative n=1 Tax=Ricinus communis TaxID=3988 RepID=B9TBR4_RICCO|nr:alpha/beta hydrolase, putative [Ricinus communis]
MVWKTLYQIISEFAAVKLRWNTALGQLFFKSVATSESVRSILCQCYHDSSQVTEELVQKILLPGLEPGAVDVFLDFICYSGGPLPEELLPQVKCPVLIAWGDKDPWEPIELGRIYGTFDTVEDFVVLPNVGHCPQLALEFVCKHLHATCINDFMAWPSLMELQRGSKGLWPVYRGKQKVLN